MTYSKHITKLVGAIRGFTLPELMVTISIMTIMTSILLFNYNTFNDSTIVNSLAYDVSLSIRQAQVYGISVLEDPTHVTQAGNPVHTNFQYSYGIHFQDATDFSLFIDLDGNHVFSNTNGQNELLQTYTLQHGDVIKDICVFTYSNTSQSLCRANNVNSLDITFMRPDPDADIVTLDSNGNTISSNIPSDPPAPNRQYGSAKITVSNASGTIKRYIIVDETGHISVSNQ